MNPQSPKPQTYQLKVWLSQKTHEWHAELRRPKDKLRLEFDSPLELARFVANISGERPSSIESTK